MEIVNQFNKQQFIGIRDAYIRLLRIEIVRLPSHSDSEIDELLRALGYLNSLAVKGYGHNSEVSTFEYNRAIYRFKKIGVFAFAAEFKRRGREVAYAPGNIVYFRTLLGTQVSFHLSDSVSNEFEQLLGVDREIIWDGVENAFAYDDSNEYEQAKEKVARLKAQYEAKEKELVQIRYDMLHRYLSRYKRAQKYGIVPDRDIVIGYDSVCLHTSCVNCDRIYKAVFGKSEHAVNLDIKKCLSRYAKRLNPEGNGIIGAYPLKEYRHTLIDPASCMPTSSEFLQMQKDISRLKSFYERRKSELVQIEYNKLLEYLSNCNRAQRYGIVLEKDLELRNGVVNLEVRNQLRKRIYCDVFGKPRPAVHKDMSNCLKRSVRLLFPDYAIRNCTIWIVRIDHIETQIDTNIILR